jgi:hypothetical protein
MPGNKAAGMNLRYASDPYWGQKTAGHMYRIDQYLGGNERNKYTLGVTTTPGVNVRTDATTGGQNKVYSYPNTGAGIIITDTVTNAEGTWFKILSDQSDFRNAQEVYVYSNGSYGNNVIQAPIAK